MTPCPVEFSLSLIIANIPAKTGAAKLVPPATVRFTLVLSRNPFAQLPVTLVIVSLEQKRYPALLAEEVSEISGTKRNVPDGMPGTPVCQLGLGVSVLTPPPPEPSPAEESSFHTCSGM